MAFLQDNDSDGSVLDDGINTASILYGAGMAGAGTVAGALGGLALTGATSVAPLAPVSVPLGLLGAGLCVGGAGMVGIGGMAGALGSTGVAGELGQGAVGLAGMVGNGISGAAQSASDFLFPPDVSADV